jgi:undecaprenyl-diphosphatase
MLGRYALLGLIQGLTEFLPISSSGHLYLFGRLIGLDPPGVLLEALLHMGTLAAILVAFRSDLADLARGFTPHGTPEHRKETGLIIAGTVPIVVVGFLLRDRMDALFSSGLAVGIGWLVTAAILLAGTVIHRRAQRNQAHFPDAIVIGLAQTAALLPGLSRSGATISAGMLCGLVPRRAARFSFLLGIPALLGAGLLTLWDAVSSGPGGDIDWLGMAVGTVVAFVVGLAAIRGLLRLVAHGRLWVFSIYCLGLAILAFVRFA